MKDYNRKTDQELKDLAMKLLQGQIFTSYQVHPADEHLMISIFMPLFLGGPDQAEWMKENNIHCLYGDMADTFGRSVNGYPMFNTVGFLNKEDADKMIEKYERMKSAVEQIE